jgi:hypothetical protein
MLLDTRNVNHFCKLRTRPCIVRLFYLTESPLLSTDCCCVQSVVPCVHRIVHITDHLDVVSTVLKALLVIHMSPRFCLIVSQWSFAILLLGFASFQHLFMPLATCFLCL